MRRTHGLCLAWLVVAGLARPCEAADEIVAEGTLALRACPFSFPVCVLLGDPGYRNYRILQDTACLERLGRHVRVTGQIAFGSCDPFDPASRVGIVPSKIEETPPPVCGDVNRDRAVNTTDAVLFFDYLFLGAMPAGSVFYDVNRDGKVDVSDAVYLLDYLYRSGPAPKCG